MTGAEKKLIEAAVLAARYLPPPSFVRSSTGYKACKGLVAAVKEWKLAKRSASEGIEP